jgi:hypothetical protein
MKYSQTSHVSSCNFLADLAVSAKASKILSGLIIEHDQLQMSLKSIHITVLPSHVFLAEQGLYVSAALLMIIHSNSSISSLSPPPIPSFDRAKKINESPFKPAEMPQDSSEISPNNLQKWVDLLLRQLANSNQELDFSAWNIWTDERGYLYFQPTPETLITWLKMLFLRTTKEDRDSLCYLEHQAIISDKNISNDCLYYIDRRCRQMQKLVSVDINPWKQHDLDFTTTVELELIYGIIEVYDSFYLGTKYKIVAASKSLVERFLEFDRTCRLLDLASNSPEFQARAGLIAIVRSTVCDLLSHNFGKI